MSDRKSRDYDYTSSSDILNRKPSRSFSMKGQKPPEMKLRSILAKAVAHFDRANDDNTKAKYVKEMWEVIEAAWQRPVIGRDLAYEISDTLRRERIVAHLVNSLQIEAAIPTLQRECARLLSQILTTDNRHLVAKSALEVVTKYTKLRDDIEIIRINISILESLFKDSEATCSKLIDLGALDTVIHACRHDDLWTARHCSAALANAAIFGGSINHKRMVNKGTQDWLFPLAFREDDFCRYYACLAVTVLAANPLVEQAVVKSGTLELVEPFVQSHDPYEFAQANPSHAQGRSASFLQRMIPLLISGRPEAQALASFYFAMEASIKAKQQKTQPLTRFLIFSEISSIIPLKRVIATSRSSIARVLAARCLKIIGEDVPRKLSSQIHLWDMEDVQSWLTVAGFRAFHASFRASTVDGEMLLLLTEKELKEDLEMANNVHRKRFIRDLNRLRAGADYRSVDTSGICEWLRQIDPKFAQYTYRFLQAGIDRSFLPLLADEHLRDDCNIGNGVHRTRILSSIQSLADSVSMDEIQDASRIHDVFISYRRNNGSHLASLLKVHLQVRGFRVFLDVESLQEGDFADRTLKSVKSASAGFILILTAGALDKCAIDHEGTDWLHKEIVTAISNKRNIVPVTTEMFQWPLPEDLPQDIASICFYNGVKWVHEYQDACVDKIVRFLKGQDPPSNKLSRIASIQSSRSGLGVSKKIRAAHPNSTVRPSGSADNLADGDRLPRPRQRTSPPGQASHTMGAVLPANRGVPGARSQSARSLDQGDGSSTPFNQNSKQAQYQTKAKSPPSKAPDLASSVKKNLTSPSSASTASTTSSKNISTIKKDIIRLDDVIRKERSRSKLSDSEDSSDYSSSDDSEGFEPESHERGGADGKSKLDVKPTQVKPSPAHVRTITAQVEKTPKRSESDQPKSPTKKSPEAEPTKSPPKELSPEHKPKPSTKYKAPPPPPPSYESVKDTPPPKVTSPPESKPTPTPRPTSVAAATNEPPLSARSGTESGQNQAEDNKLNVAKSTPKVVSQPIVGKFEPKLSAKPESKLSSNPVPVAKTEPKPVMKPAQNSTSASRSAMENNAPAPAKYEPNSAKVDEKQPAVPRNDSPNMVQKPPRSAANKDKPVKDMEQYKPAKEVERNMPEIPFADSKSASESSDDSSSTDHERQSNGLRTNADGFDGASSRSLSRTSSSAPSDLGQAAMDEGKTENPIRNSNNSNNIHINGLEERREPHPNQKNGHAPHPGSQTRTASSRSIPLSRSSHSITSADTHSPPRSPTRTAPPGAGKPVVRRDVAPPTSYSVPKRSASERLQMTRPPHPHYPMGHFPPPGITHHHHHSNPVNPGYNMDQYKAAMAASIRAPYPGHQSYPHSSGHPHAKSRSGPQAHGFDTAV